MRKIVVFFEVEDDMVRTFLMGMQLDLNNNTDGKFIGYQDMPITKEESKRGKSRPLRMHGAFEDHIV